MAQEFSASAEWLQHNLARYTVSKNLRLLGRVLSQINRIFDKRTTAAHKPSQACYSSSLRVGLNGDLHARRYSTTKKMGKLSAPFTASRCKRSSGLRGTKQPSKPGSSRLARSRRRLRLPIGRPSSEPPRRSTDSSHRSWQPRRHRPRTKRWSFSRRTTFHRDMLVEFRVATVLLPAFKILISLKSRTLYECKPPCDPADRGRMRQDKIQGLVPPDLDSYRS